MKNNNKVLSLLGLATKAGKVASGEFSTEKSVKTGKGFLVLVADDASQNTRKKFQNMCDFYEVPIYFIANKEELGRFCGKEFRASFAELIPTTSPSIFRSAPPLLPGLIAASV